MEDNNFSSKDLERASLLKQAQLYAQGGWKKARYLGRNFPDYENHLFAFLIDLNICLLPVYVWGLEFILILTGVISPMYFDLLFYIMYGCLFLMSCVLLPLYTVSTKGQTLGCRIIGLRLVDSNKRMASSMKLMLNLALGFGVPMMLLGYFFSVVGVMAWWLLNALVVLISPRQQNIMDLALSMALVITPEYKFRIGAQKVAQPQPAEEPVQPVRQQPVQPAPMQQPEPAQMEEGFSPIDLHIRSNYSDDARLDVEEIIKQARDKNMEVISITDHNCARANAQAVRFASLYNLRYIPGVEIDTLLNGQRLRILGYYIDWNNPVFDEVERASLKREKDASIARVEAFEKLMGISIDIDSIISRSRFQIISPSDLTYMVFKNEKTRQKPLVQQFLQQAGGDENAAKTAFKKAVFSKGGPCEIRTPYPDAASIIASIHEAGGMAVLAGWRVDELQDETLEALLDAGLDGVEAFTPNNSADATRFLLSLANQEKLFVTAGSDYHGPVRPGRQLGRTTCPPKGLPTVRIFTRALEKVPDEI